jgi:hypothetical protein
LDKRRNPTRLAAQGVLGISSLGKGAEEGFKMVIKIGLTERPGGCVLLGHDVSPLIWRCCQT